MLRVKGVHLFETTSALCRDSVKQTCMALVSNYLILTAAVQTRRHNNFHFILTSRSNRVSIKHAGYQYKAPSKAAKLHKLSQNQTFINIPTISCHCSCLLASFAKGKGCCCCCCFGLVFFFFNIRDDMLLLDMIPKMNIWLEYLTVHKSTQGFLLGPLLLVRRSKLTEEEKNHNETVSLREKKIIFTGRFGTFYLLYSFNIFLKFVAAGLWTPLF